MILHIRYYIGYSIVYLVYVTVIPYTTFCTPISWTKYNFIKNFSIKKYSTSYNPSFRAGSKRICSNNKYNSLKPNFIRNKTIVFDKGYHVWIYYAIWSAFNKLGFEKNCIIKFGIKSEIYSLIFLYILQYL